MQLSVNGIDAFVATGGREFDAAEPTVVLLHGAGFDHTAWALHSRWLAHHGHSVLAPDLPGHGRSPVRLPDHCRNGRLDRRAARRRRCHQGMARGSFHGIADCDRDRGTTPVEGLRTQPDRNRGHHDRRTRSAQGGRGQRHLGDRYGFDLGPRLSGRTGRQPCAGIVDAQRSAAGSRAMPARRAVQRSFRLQRLSRTRWPLPRRSMFRPPSFSANAI